MIKHTKLCCSSRLEPELTSLETFFLAFGMIILWHSTTSHWLFPWKQQNWTLGLLIIVIKFRNNKPWMPVHLLVGNLNILVFFLWIKFRCSDYKCHKHRYNSHKYYISIRSHAWLSLTVKKMSCMTKGLFLDKSFRFWYMTTCHLM